MSKILSQREWDAVSCAAVPVDEPFPTATVIDARMKLSAHDAALRAENARLREAAQVASDLLSAVHPKDSQSIYLIERVRALMEGSK